MSSYPVHTFDSPRLEDGDGFTSIKVVAPRLGVSTHVLRKYIREGRLPAYRLGGRILIKWADVEALIEPLVPSGGDAA